MVPVSEKKNLSEWTVRVDMKVVSDRYGWTSPASVDMYPK